MADQQNWRWCSKCKSIFFSMMAGRCAAGGAHDSRGSSAYAIPMAPPDGVNSQEGWRWCSKCQVLFYAPLGGGSCPAGDKHDATTSGQYWMAASPYPSGGGQ